MANPYPAVVEDLGKSVRIDGFIDFNDPANQPGGTSPYLIVVKFSSQGGRIAPSVTDVLVPNTLVGGTSHGGDGAVGIMTGIPTVVGAASHVLEGGDFVLTTAGTVPSTSDPLDLELTVYVTDMTGTNTASIDVTTSVASPVTDTAATLDLTAGTWTITAGTDLSDDTGGALKSTAGGVFVCYATCSVKWD